MKKKIGIIGGAGPVAGLLLFKKIIKVCQKEYGCIKDSDFPEITLHSFPFTDMLERPDEEILASELKKSLQLLEDIGCDILLIACNTLHGFLDRSGNKKLINLIDETKKQMSDQSLILCTNTSSQKNIYGQNCLAVDELINKILAGKHTLNDSLWLKSIIEKKQVESAVLGCTELSVLSDEYPINIAGTRIIDPLDIISKKTCKNIFKKGEKN